MCGLISRSENQMSIPNELSSDIAVALLARVGDDPKRLTELKEVILRVHATLQEKSKRADETLMRARAARANSKQSVEVKRQNSN